MRFEQNLVRSNSVKHRPSKGVKLGVVCVPVAEISRVLIVGVRVGRLPASVPVGLRRRSSRRPQHCPSSNGLGQSELLKLINGSKLFGNTKFAAK
jgi:hypothetical protein